MRQNILYAGALEQLTEDHRAIVCVGKRQSGRLKKKSASQGGAKSYGTCGKMAADCSSKVPPSIELALTIQSVACQCCGEHELLPRLAKEGPLPTIRARERKNRSRHMRLAGSGVCAQADAENQTDAHAFTPTGTTSLREDERCPEIFSLRARHGKHQDGVQWLRYDVLLPLVL